MILTANMEMYCQCTPGSMIGAISATGGMITYVGVGAIVYNTGVSMSSCMIIGGISGMITGAIVGRAAENVLTQ